MARMPHRRQAYRALLAGHPLYDTPAARGALSRSYAQAYAMMADHADGSRWVASGVVLRG